MAALLKSSILVDRFLEDTFFLTFGGVRLDLGTQALEQKVTTNTRAISTDLQSVRYVGSVIFFKGYHPDQFVTAEEVNPGKKFRQ